MNRPQLDIPESQKTDDWKRELALSFASDALQSIGEKEIDIKCWRFFNNEFLESDYEYLFKNSEGGKDYALPAKFRWYGYQRTYCQYMISLQTTRPFPFSVASVDDESITEKMYAQAKMYVSELFAQSKSAYFQQRAQIEKIRRKQEQIQQMVQQEPQNEEQAQAIRQLSDQLPDIMAEFNTMINVLETTTGLGEKQIDELEEKMAFSPYDMAEEHGRTLLLALKDNDQLIKKITKAFKSKVVTGKVYYMVDYVPGRKTPLFEAISELNIIHPSDIEVEYVHEGPWAGVRRNIGYDEVLRKYGQYLSDKDKKRLKDAQNYSSGKFYSVSPSLAVDVKNTSGVGNYRGGTLSGSVVTETKIYIRVPRRIYVKESPNKYVTDGYFTHFIDESDIEKVRPQRGEKLSVRYVDDLYEAVVLNDNIFVYCEKREDVVRDNDNPAMIYLPIFGKMFNGMEKPYSLIWATKDIQILIGIINWYKELLVTTSGVKGQIVDESQIPDDMSTEEHEHHRKKGSLYIQTVGKGGRITSSYNQWKSFDDTISQSVVTLDNMIESLNMTMGRMMGIPQQALGQLRDNELVGTAEFSRDQSNLVTEIIYDEFDDITRQALSHYIRISTKINFKNGGLVQRFNTSEGRQISKIPAGIFEGKDMTVYLANTLKDENQVKLLKQFAMAHYQKNGMPFHDLVAVYGLDNLTTLEKRLRHLSEKAQDIQMQQASNLEAQRSQAEKEKIQLEAELRKMADDEKNRIEAMRLEIERGRAQVDAEFKSQDMALKKRALDQEAVLKEMEIMAENVTENRYLDEQTRSSKVSERLQALELKLKALMESANLTMTDTVSKRTAATKKVAREHISDR